MRRDFIPAEGDVLCEQCGYVLNGLPPEGNCPECGKPVAQSTTESPRCPPAWEAGRDHAVGRFQATALALLRGPRRCFRQMTAHGDAARSGQFARIAILPAVLFNTKTVVMHGIVMHLKFGSPSRGLLVAMLPIAPIVAAAAWLGLYAAVVRLTTLESRYWGMRLPRGVVNRAMHYNAVYASVASLLPWAVTLAYLCLLIGSRDGGRFVEHYLYILSGAVVISAVYLFAVYAASMRALMYANR